MHIPKSGGTSVIQALKRALPSNTLNHKSLDRSTFCGGFDDFDKLPPDRRSQIAATDDELRSMRTSRIIAGHFAFGSLALLAPPASMATVLREPRAQLLSLYASWRLNAAEFRDLWHPYSVADSAERPLQEFLADPAIAPMIDQPLCRMLVFDRGGIPGDDFIPGSSASSVASAAIDRIETLGFVGILEFERHMWTGLSAFFGVPLQPLRVNVTAAPPSDRPRPGQVHLTPRAVELLEARTAADALVYEYILVRVGGLRDRVATMRAAAFGMQLVRLGDLFGESASAVTTLHSQLHKGERKIRALEARLAARAAADHESG